MIDAANLAFGLQTISATIRNNLCDGSQTCISVEHVNESRIIDNKCRSLQFGIELHDSLNSHTRDNEFRFPPGGCEIHTLARGDKLDFYRVAPGAGICTSQG